MKNAVLYISIIAAGLLIGRPLFSIAQNINTIKLEQTTGEFKTTELTLEAGKPYAFEVTNVGVDHEVGFVIAPAGKTDADNHVKNAYLANTIADGESARSQVVVLEAGEYVYWCPLNPTPQYKITVKE